MKIRTSHKKYFYIELTIILMIIIGTVLYWYSSSVQDRSARQSFVILDESRDQLGQMITNEMENEQEHLEAASSLLRDLLPEHQKNQQEILKIMNASSAENAYTHWEICFPDESGVRTNGETFKLLPKYSFRDRVKKGFTVSERRTSLKDDKTQIIMLSNPIFKDGKCVGIISAVIELKEFARAFHSNIYGQQADIMLFERESGDVLINYWESTLGNMKNGGKRSILSAAGGYDWTTITENYNKEKNGHAAFMSQKKGETVYFSYAKIGYSDWELLLFVPGSVCMQTANANRATAYLAFTVIAAAVFGFFILITMGERKRQRINEARSRELSAALKKANEANVAKSRFLSRMSHDIRTPLNGIIGFLDLFESRKESLETLEVQSRKVRVAAEHLLSLINDILNMSKLENNKVELSHEAFDIRQLAEEILSITQIRAEEVGITIHYEDCGKNIRHPYIYGSPLHVRQIFVNILSNAIKYNKPDGEIFAKIESKKCTEKKIFYTCTITDTGIGMSREFLQHLFEPFVQEKVDARSVYYGTGLGMAIVKSLVDMMHGMINVVSRPGEGTTFEVTIPFDIAEKEDLEGYVKRKEEVSIEGVKILLVEDNDLNREIATTLLKEQEAEITTAVNGAEAVAAYEQAPDGTFDVILMDILMPVMDGLEAVRAIRALDRKEAKTIPIIALTANAFAEDIRKSKEAGMNAHISKPIQLDKMVCVIAGLVHESR